jgi:hypothetical protein
MRNIMSSELQRRLLAVHVAQATPLKSKFRPFPVAPAVLYPISVFAAAVAAVALA